MAKARRSGPAKTLGFVFSGHADLLGKRRALDEIFVPKGAPESLRLRIHRSVDAIVIPLKR